MGTESDRDGKVSVFHSVVSVIKAVRSGNRAMKRLALLISLNLAYSTTELMIGLFTGRVGEIFGFFLFFSFLFYKWVLVYEALYLNLEHNCTQTNV